MQNKNKLLNKLETQGYLFQIINLSTAKNELNSKEENMLSHLFVAISVTQTNNLEFWICRTAFYPQVLESTLGLYRVSKHQIRIIKNRYGWMIVHTISSTISNMQLTFCQSILSGWSTFWLERRKSITGPGLTIIVVETSAS